jgi:hypothetical protein
MWCLKRYIARETNHAILLDAGSDFRRVDADRSVQVRSALSELEEGSRLTPRKDHLAEELSSRGIGAVVHSRDLTRSRLVTLPARTSDG